jgi:hypothetical protein
MLRRRSLSLIALAIGTHTLAVAQNVNGAIVGTVRDSSSSVIAGAKVTVTNEDTNFEYRAETGSTGDFVVPNLPPGVYTVSSERPGFKQSIAKGLSLLANRSLRVDLVLEPGTLAQSVEVQTSAPVVNSENATIGNIMESGTSPRCRSTDARWTD